MSLKQSRNALEDCICVMENSLHLSKSFSLKVCDITDKVIDTLKIVRCYSINIHKGSI